MRPHMVGDVGYEPEDVERNMGKHFKLANRWGCVLLLDEADVFLAKRNVKLTSSTLEKRGKTSGRANSEP